MIRAEEVGAKLTDTQRAKLAYVYIRQSTLTQVRCNTESTARQYELVERAMALGWPAARIQVIDADLAKSGARSDLRLGFQHLLAEISLGRVGLVLSLEAARLARNCADWYRLLELCSIFGAALADGERVYDPRLYHDRLLLGLAGMMSEAELHHLQLRLHAGQRHKAERGELNLPLPAGLERLRSGEVVLHPDEEIQARLRLVFAKFEQLGSARAVAGYLHQQQLALPTRPQQGPSPWPIVWVPAKTNGVLNILQNPAYAGAYAYGKTTVDPSRRQSGAATSGVIRRSLEQWPICLRDTYPAYIPWEQFTANQQHLRANQYRYRDARPGAPRTGQALLQGIAFCGRCGARLWVRYRGAAGGQPSYVCNERAREFGEPRCQEIHAADVDPAIEQMILHALEPDKLALALEAFAHLEDEAAALEQQWRLRLERARFEAARAQRQYDAVEPDNRLVARNLERHWETKLRAVDALERDYEQWRRQHPPTLSATDRQEILALGQNLPNLWTAATTTNADRKRIVRLVIREVILDQTRAKEKVWLQLNWQTGAITQHWITRSVTRYQDLSNLNDLRQRLQALKAAGMSDQAITTQLNAEGFRASHGGSLTRISIWYLRHRWGIESARQERKTAPPRCWQDGSYTLQGTAAVLGVHPRTVHTWIDRGRVETQQAYPGGPLKIILSEARIQELRTYVTQVRRPRRHALSEGDGQGGNRDNEQNEAGSEPSCQRPSARARARNRQAIIPR